MGYGGALSAYKKTRRHGIILTGLQKFILPPIPCYYHNYLLGDLLAAQLSAYFENNIIGEKEPSYSGHPELGEYLVEKVFRPGSRYYWNEMIERATGEKLTAGHYADQYVK